MQGKSNGITRTLAYAFGFGLGTAWIAIAIYVLVSAANGFRNDRLDWGVGWGIVGLFLLAAGTCAIVGTWWHQNRVLKRHH